MKVNAFSHWSTKLGQSCNIGMVWGVYIYILSKVLLSALEKKLVGRRGRFHGIFFELPQRFPQMSQGGVFYGAFSWFIFRKGQKRDLRGIWQRLKDLGLFPNWVLNKKGFGGFILDFYLFISFLFQSICHKAYPFYETQCYWCMVQCCLVFMCYILLNSFLAVLVLIYNIKALES